MSFLVASGKKDGKAEFKSYMPLPVSNVAESKGKVFQLCHWTVYNNKSEFPNYYTQRIGIVYTSNNKPPTNSNQNWYVDFFQAQVECKGQQGTTDLYSTARPDFERYNVDKKIGVISFTYTNDTPSSIGGWKPSNLLYFYQNDDVNFYVPNLGTYYAYDESLNFSFWERASHLKPKLPFEIDISTEGGGDGEYDDNTSDTIGLPDLTALNQNSISNTKFLTCYQMTQAQLSKLGEELWSENFFHQIANSVLKPTDFIVNLSLLPVAVGGVTKYIKAGKIYLNGAEGTLISQQFIRVDCGTLEVKKKWGGAIDYQTDVSIFLPFIGEQSLNANEVMGASLNVIYTVDILSGSCIASIRVINDNLDAVLYQFTGNMASNYPITSADYSTVFAATLQVAIGETNLGNAGGVLSMVSATSNLLRGPEVKRTGSLSSSTGFMGIKKPYLILSRPIQSLPSEYNTFRGFVSNITLSLSDCSGYTKVAEIHLENIPATEAEISEIESLLKSGVLIN